MQSLDGRKPDIVYPCSWSYNVIGLDEPSLRSAVAEVLGDGVHTIAPGNASPGGKYVSLALEARVADEAQRLEIFKRLAGHPSIRFVI
jgi:putative lipoic acid-binding regulatory protein